MSHAAAKASRQLARAVLAKRGIAAPAPALVRQCARIHRDLMQQGLAPHAPLASRPVPVHS